MNVTRLLTSALSRGLVLCILGFLIVIPSYFLLPVGIAKVCDQFFCPYFRTPRVSDFLIESLTPPIAPWLTLFTILPLFIAVVILVCGLLYARQQQKMVLRLFLGSWIIGLIYLLVLLLFVTIYWNLAIGFFGLVLGYALFFGGYRTFLADSPSRMP